MTFDEALRQYADLQARWQRGWLTQEQFVAAVSQLRVQDQRGVWWQLHPTAGTWLYYDGRTWQAAPSPTPQAPQRAAYPQSAAQPMRQGVAPAAARPMPAGVPGAVPRPTGGDRGKPLAQRSQRWFNIASIVGGGVAGTLWLLYSSIRSAREGIDVITPLIMIALPIVFAVLRGPIDRLLSVFDPIRRRIPRILLVGAGLAIPFVVAMLLYGDQTEYPYLRLSTLWGTLASYVVLRTPRPAQGSTARRGGAR